MGDDQGHGARILVVDDEPGIVEVISMVLRDQGFVVEAAASGQEALDRVRNWRPHAMVLDVMLSDMEGFDVTEFRLLRYLMFNPRLVLSRGQLLDHVWNYDFDGDACVLETYISYLQKKVDVGGLPLLHTVRGVGYALRLPRG